MEINSKKNIQPNNHEIRITGRESMQVTGVLNVESFDSEEFLLQTQVGYLGIKGTELNIRNLDLEKGVLAIDGYVIDVSYLDALTPKEEKSKGLFSRLFQ